MGGAGLGAAAAHVALAVIRLGHRCWLNIRLGRRGGARGGICIAEGACAHQERRSAHTHVCERGWCGGMVHIRAWSLRTAREGGAGAWCAVASDGMARVSVPHAGAMQVHTDGSATHGFRRGHPSAMATARMQSLRLPLREFTSDQDAYRTRVHVLRRGAGGAAHANNTGAMQVHTPPSVLSPRTVGLGMVLPCPRLLLRGFPSDQDAAHGRRGCGEGGSAGGTTGGAMQVHTSPSVLSLVASGGFCLACGFHSGGSPLTRPPAGHGGARVQGMARGAAGGRWVERMS